MSGKKPEGIPLPTEPSSFARGVLEWLLGVVVGNEVNLSDVPIERDSSQPPRATPSGEKGGKGGGGER